MPARGLDFTCRYVRIVCVRVVCVRVVCVRVVCVRIVCVRIVCVRIVCVLYAVVQCDARIRNTKYIALIKPSVQ